ncbi:MAG: FtsX-like permease family protein [Eubacteriales bacterium]|nr:FtsX-like permease family protein [Eubacteriales bacterium]
MDIFKRAVLFNIRKKEKSLTLFLLFALITLFTTVGFSVLNAAQSAAARLRETIGASFTLQGKPEEFDFSTDGKHYSTQLVPISQQMIDGITNNKEIKGYNARQSAPVYADGLYFTSGTSYGTISANTATEWNRNFTNGTLTLERGKHITGEGHGTALISRELAKENNLDVGDCISISYAEDNLAANAVPLQIAGIYVSDADMEFDNDTIFTGHDSYWELTGDTPGTFSGGVDFFVTDPARLDLVIEQIRKNESVMWDNYILQADATEYKAIADQLASMRRLTTLLIVSSVVVSAVILFLILSMRIKSRIHETGILLAVGVSKGAVILQFITETMVLLFLAILVSCPIGYAAAVQIETFLQDRIGVISIGVPVPTLLLQYSVETVIVLFGVAAAAYPIIKLKPKDILSKMS